MLKFLSSDRKQIPKKVLPSVEYHDPVKMFTIALSTEQSGLVTLHGHYSHCTGTCETDGQTE